jgi:hypothetical protein
MTLQATMTLFLVLQIFQVVFIGLHDWIPLGRFNDVKAARAANPGHVLLTTTAFSAAPFALVLGASLLWMGRPYPGWLLTWLWISYGVLFAGELRAWWIPYLIAPDPVRAARYETMFGRTVSFLPARNGIRPNTLHVILHAATLATLVVLALITARRH